MHHMKIHCLTQLRLLHRVCDVGRRTRSTREAVYIAPYSIVFDMNRHRDPHPPRAIRHRAKRCHQPDYSP